MQTTAQALAQLKGQKLTKCSNCNTLVQADGFTDRQREDDLIEIGLECPNCEACYHSYFVNDDLRRNRPKPTDSRRERREYQKRFQRFQKRIRQRLGMKKIGGRWREVDGQSGNS